MTSPGNVMILASAGSGKTYALTNRFVRLLALGAKPERIVALTFTRKAAGEFFDEILKKLAKAAADEVYAATLAGEIEAPGLRSTAFLGMLRTVVEAMPRLQLGTLDGFFARIVSNFPFELGLTGVFEIMEDHAASVERGRVLRQLFERTGELDEAQREFIEAFKRATFGMEEKRLRVQLDAFIDRHQEVFLDVPAAERWGSPGAIWPAGNAWVESASLRGEAVKSLGAALPALPMDEKQRVRWQGFLTELAEWSPGAALGKEMIYLLGNAFKAWPALSEIMVERKKLPLTLPVSEALRATIMGVVGGEYVRRLEMTRGIHAVLAGYERCYHDAVRRGGKLTFGDVQRLLLTGAGDERSLSGDAAVEGRLFVDYRLDGQIDHWLLDEFQDTSFGQWSVLRSLIDEAVQDPTGARTFFYVGDVKQAIFAWRDGDPRLFREIFDHYNAVQPGTIAEEHLVQSWRSGPPIIDAVNRVFGNAAVLGTMFPGDASARWNHEWRDHISAKPGQGGQVAWLHAEDEEARFATVLAILQEIEPLERGLSCALLVQKNDTAAALADYLRREGGLPAVADSDLHVGVDNPLGCALLALVQAAAHPGDTLAREHLRMTPVWNVVEAAGLTVPDALTKQVLGEIHADGFERLFARWMTLLEPHLDPDDHFSRERGRQFRAAAALFDAMGSRDVAEFVVFLERHTIRESESAEVLRVMTVHKSKGLGFDVVVLPDLEGTKLDSRRDGLAVRRAADRAVEWVLDLPSKVLAERDPGLARYIRDAESEACYEALSLLYVAMTRAKRAMYAVTKAPGKSKSNNYRRILAETLGDGDLAIQIGRREFAGAFALGDGDWFRALKSTPVPDAVLEIEALHVGNRQEGGKRLVAHRASAGKGGELTGAQLFALEAGSAAEFGTAVHRLLAEVEWSTGKEPAERARTWRERGEQEAAVTEVLACLNSPALRAVWARGSRGEVWRERAFEIVMDGRWVTGVFDRVTLERGMDGHPTHVWVYDFKTDAVPSTDRMLQAARRHEEQMALYRRVAGCLTGLPEGKVSAVVVFTALRMPVAL